VNYRLYTISPPVLLLTVAIYGAIGDSVDAYGYTRLWRHAPQYISTHQFLYNLLSFMFRTLKHGTLFCTMSN